MIPDIAPGRPRLIEVKAPNKTALPGLGVLADAFLEVPSTEQVFDVKSMTSDPDSVGMVIKNLFKAVPDGRKKRFYPDSYADMQTAGVWHKLNSYIPTLKPRIASIVGEKQEFFRELRALGVEIDFRNPPRNAKESHIPLLNRDHIKGIRKDRSVFYFGGVNFDQDTVHFAEFMVKFTGVIAGKLADEFDILHQDPYTEDREIQLTNNTWLYIDAGIPGQSISRHKAIAITQGARRYVYDSSFFPRGGTMANEFSEAAKRGAEVESLTHYPSLPHSLRSICEQVYPPFTWDNLQLALSLLNRFSQRRQGHNFTTLVNPFRDQHCKLTIADDGNSDIAIFGTNNHEDKAINAGTREWSILTWDPELVDNLKRKYFDFRLETDQALQGVL